MTPISSAAEFSALRMISTVMGSARFTWISCEVASRPMLRRELAKCGPLDKALLLAHRTPVGEGTVRVELAVVGDDCRDRCVFRKGARTPHQDLRVWMSRLAIQVDRG